MTLLIFLALALNERKSQVINSNFPQKYLGNWIFEKSITSGPRGLKGLKNLKKN